MNEAGLYQRYLAMLALSEEDSVRALDVREARRFLVLAMALSEMQEEARR